MANKIKAIKIKRENGTYTEEIPISVNVQNVQWDENNHTLLDALGSVNISSSGKGNLQHQIDELDGDKISTNEFNSRLNDFLKDQISADTTDWLDDNVNPVGSAIIVNKTLTIEGAAADAKKVGDELSQVKADLEAQGEVSVRYDEQQNKGDNEKHQALLNIGSIDLMYEVKQALNDRYVQMLDNFKICLELLANAEFLTDNTSKFSEVSRMFNKIENQYAVSFKVVFSFPEREASPIFKGIGIKQTTRNDRGAIFSLFSATHALKDENGNDTNYYPIQIPAKATLVYSNNAREMGLAINYHVLKYDETLGDYIRVFVSNYHFGNPKNDGAYIFDISDYNDGTYYLVCSIGTADSERVNNNRNIEDIYVGQKTKASMTNNVLTYDQIKGTNITIV